MGARPLQWVLIGHWPDDADRQEVDPSVAHIWTGPMGVACKVEDFGMAREAPSTTPRCATCATWAIG
jgi:hypothetical protein